MLKEIHLEKASSLVLTTRPAHPARGVVIHHDDGVIEKAGNLLAFETPQQALEQPVSAECADANGDMIGHSDEYDIIENRGNIKNRALCGLEAEPVHELVPLDR
jgi:hypothetical protein